MKTFFFTYVLHYDKVHKQKVRRPVCQNHLGRNRALEAQMGEGGTHLRLAHGFFEKVLFGDGREWVCSQAHGEVLEVAVGTGRNFPFYPEGVRLTGIDLSPARLEIARKKAELVGLDADLREGAAQELPFPDASFDAVVCTLSLCTIPDERRAVAEMKRVLRPRGRLLLLDHIRASSKVWLAVQRVLEPLSWKSSCDHLLRRPLEHVVAEGFEVEQRERYKAGIVERLSARRPG